MIKSEIEKKTENVCDLKYLNETMGGKKNLIKEIIDIFLQQVPEELLSINNAILKADYPTIRKLAHTMKSTVSIMGISSLAPVLQEMEDLGTKETGIEKVVQLSHLLNSICKKAIEETETEKSKYV